MTVSERPRVEEKLRKLAKHAEDTGTPYEEVLRSAIRKWRTGAEAAKAKAADESFSAEARATAAANARDATYAVRLFELELERVTGEEL